VAVELTAQLVGPTTDRMGNSLGHLPTLRFGCP